MNQLILYVRQKNNNHTMTNFSSLSLMTRSTMCSKLTKQIINESVYRLVRHSSPVKMCNGLQFVINKKLHERENETSKKTTTANKTKSMRNINQIIK